MVGTGQIMSMRLIRSKLRKREESSHPASNNVEANQPTQVVSSQANHLTTEPSFRQNPANQIWMFPPLPPQPNLYIYNASSQVSFLCHIFILLMSLMN